MATATKSRRTRKSTTKPADKVSTAAKRIVRKPAAKKAAPAKPAAPKREQDSVTITYKRGKRDRITREIMPHEPQAGGGVRFEEISDKGASPVYMSQEQDTKLGKPEFLRGTFKVLKTARG